MAEVPDLTEIANQYGSDKGDAIFHAHGYTKFYSFLFEQFRLEHFHMLEIGLHRGEIDPDRLLTRKLSSVPSIKMWLDFFPNAEAFGFDISDFSDAKEERFNFYRGDMGCIDDLNRLRSELPPLRIIIDDGSHAAYHQQMAFTHLFEKVESGGFYVIEDLHATHPIERSLPQVPRTAEIFDHFTQSGELPLPHATPHQIGWLKRQIKNVFVHRSSTGGVQQWSPKMIVLERR